MKSILDTINLVAFLDVDKLISRHKTNQYTQTESIIN